MEKEQTDKNFYDRKWSLAYMPLCNKIENLLTNDREKANFNQLVSDLMNAETDAVYWRNKYYGTWPSDTVQDIQVHIKILENRIQELQK